MVDEFVTGEGENDGFIPGPIAPVTIRIGGVPYTVSCPPDTKWHGFAPLAQSPDAGSEAAFAFLSCALPEDDFEAVFRQLAEGETTLLRLLYAVRRAIDHFHPAVAAHFEAMGMEPPPNPTGNTTEATPRPVPTPAGSRLGLAGPRAPKDQTGARTGS